MITLFSTAKPFRGHSRVIQHNALKSWTLLHPDIEVILFGNDEGAAEAARELGLRHEVQVERTEFGASRIDSMLAKAEELARHEVLCFLNCDIILLPDFCQAIGQLKLAHSEFLAVGRRWDTPITEPIDFASASWPDEMRKRALASNHRQSEWYIDYFVFTRGFWGGEIPALAVGRVFWDNWMVWKGLQVGKPVVDVSSMVVAVHQNHDYSHHPMGKEGVWGGPEAARNLELAGGWRHLRNISDAAEILRPSGLKPNRRRHWESFKRVVGATGRFLRFRIWNPVWFFLLGVTRPLRQALGLRSEALKRSREKP